MDTQRAVGAWAWLIASLPQGNAYGQRLRKASTPTHQQPTATGQPGRRSISRCPIANRPKITASAIASAAHAYQATLISQDSSGTKNARPNASPTRKEPRRLRRQSAITSSAGATAANGQIPVGGNAASSASPPTIAITSASSMGTPRRRPAVASAAAAAACAEAAAGCAGVSAAWVDVAPGCAWSASDAIPSLACPADAAPGTPKPATASAAPWPASPVCGTVPPTRHPGSDKARVARPAGGCARRTPPKIGTPPQTQACPGARTATGSALPRGARGC